MLRKAIFTSLCVLALLVTIFVVAAEKTSRRHGSAPYKCVWFYEGTNDLPAQYREGLFTTLHMEDEINKLKEQGYEVVSVAGISGRSDSNDAFGRQTHFVVTLRRTQP
jgi:hypothetical protein